MRDSIPWVRPPRWIDCSRRLLRNADHHPGNNRTEGHEAPPIGSAEEPRSRRPTSVATAPARRLNVNTN